MILTSIVNHPFPPCWEVLTVLGEKAIAFCLSAFCFFRSSSSISITCLRNVTARVTTSPRNVQKRPNNIIGGSGCGADLRCLGGVSLLFTWPWSCWIEQAALSERVDVKVLLRSQSNLISAASVLGISKKKGHIDQRCRWRRKLADLTLTCGVNQLIQYGELARRR